MYGKQKLSVQFDRKKNRAGTKVKKENNVKIIYAFRFFIYLPRAFLIFFFLTIKFKTYYKILGLWKWVIVLCTIQQNFVRVPNVTINKGFQKFISFSYVATVEKAIG